MDKYVAVSKEECTFPFGQEKFQKFNTDVCPMILGFLGVMTRSGLLGCRAETTGRISDLGHRKALLVYVLLPMESRGPYIHNSPQNMTSELNFLGL
jgi:hypothetical protein